MITLFTGAPGAGKTAAMVDYLRTIVGDRPVFADGLDGLTLDHSLIDSNDWPTLVPDGGVLVIDEVQRVWRPRGPGAKVPLSVSELETHRHRGIDVFLTTQSPRLLDANVRALVGRHVHIRDTGILGRYVYEWPEVSEDLAWKTCVNKRRFKLPKAAFALYKSASLHVAPVRSVPLMLYVAVAAFLLLLAGAYYIYSMLHRINAPPVPPVVLHAPAADASSFAGGPPVPRLIDDRVDFVPRVGNKPESAPAYDHLRVIAVMPQVVGGFCEGDFCRCFTQQWTDPGLSARDCADWIHHTPFNPYAPSLAGNGYVVPVQSSRSQIVPLAAL